ncbi:MAG: hypothetical protein QOI89_515 [Solirubrobacteraceae bacterium]|jgi:uncharacterized protein (DUF2267 family)|nr:hypothetical protein [Solirubrobacteraceae bacterium]
MLRSVDAIERSVHKTNEWLSDLAAELGIEDKEDAWRILKVYLQMLRDQLTIDEAAQLAAQLTLVLRGAFFEGFDPGRQDKLRDRDEFLARFAERAGVTYAARAVEAATRVVRRHITAGEMDDVLSQLPSELREVLLQG